MQNYVIFFYFQIFSFFILETIIFLVFYLIFVFFVCVGANGNFLVALAFSAHSRLIVKCQKFAPIAQFSYNEKATANQENDMCLSFFLLEQ